VHTGSDDLVEQKIANRRRERNEKSAGFCPNCGGPLQKSDRFCPKCGFEIA
jgi:predicted amidophosphoribosyltransferase